jgi:hypothetical protein
MVSIEGSSEPFRAFIGAILSVIKGVSVEPSTFDPDMELDIIIDDEAGGSSEGIDHLMTCGRMHAFGENTESGLMVRPFLDRYLLLGLLVNFQVTSSSPKSPESLQVWEHLYTLPTNSFALPQCTGCRKPRLWLTRSIGFGSTGRVWQCHFDNSDVSFAAKIVEVLRRSDANRRQRLRNEFNVYRRLDKAYQSGKLRDRIAPHCYGAFEGDGVDVLILELCDGILRDWDELNDSER